MAEKSFPTADVRTLSDEELLAIIASSNRVTSGPGLVETGIDVAKSAGVGAGEAAIGLAGLPGDVQSLARMGAEKISPGSSSIIPQQQFPTSREIKSAVEQWTGPFYEPKTGAGQVAHSVGEQAPGFLFPGGAVQRTINVVAPALGAEAAEAVAGDSPTAKAIGTLVGGVLGARGITPAPSTPERARLAALLEGEGVKLTAGQRTGNRPLMWFEQAAADTPFAAGRAAQLNEAQGRAFTGAVMKRIGASGDEIATPDAVDRAVRSLSQRFEDLASRNTLTVDQQLGNDLVQTAQQYVATVPPSRQAPIVNELMQDIIQVGQQTNGVIPGTTYQAWRSRIDKMARGLRQSDPQLSEALFGIRNALDDAMTRSISPADQAAWAEARTQWRNWKAIERAASGSGSQSAEGFISPSQLRTAVAGQDRGGYARGRGDMADLARAGEALLKPLPQSGTAPRQAAGNLFASMAGGLVGTQVGGPEAVIAGMAAPAAAGRVMLSAPMQSYLGNQLLPMTRGEMYRRLLAQQLLARPEETRP